jgi:HSP20 family protein
MPRAAERARRTKKPRRARHLPPAGFASAVRVQRLDVLPCEPRSAARVARSARAVRRRRARCEARGLQRQPTSKEVVMGTMQPTTQNPPQERSQEQEERPLARSSPFGVLRRFMEDIDRMFAPEHEALWAPQIEVLEKDGKLVVRADLPGLKSEDVRVDVDHGLLTISGERKREKVEKREEGTYHSERSYGSFLRRVALPEDVDADKIEAKFEDGVLEVTIPATPPGPRGKSIPVKGGTTH